MSRNELRGAPIWSGVCASVLLLVPGYGGTPYWRSKLIFRRCLLSNRREFLQLTLAASALPALAARNEPIGPARLAQNGPRVRVDNVIVESTSPMAIAFGNEAMRFGLEVQGITDDVTDVWYQHLAERWSRGSAVVAGLTLSTSLFCLETMANDRGMRLCFRADHAALANGQAQHEVSGARQLVERAAVFQRDWVCGFAGLLAALPPWQAEKSQSNFIDPSPDRLWAPGPMVSWIIAPRLAAQLPLV
jgi:hypothetical protein